MGAMHMAFAYLNLPGRIWQANGLNYILSAGQPGLNPESRDSASVIGAKAPNERPQTRPAAQGLQKSGSMDSPGQKSARDIAPSRIWKPLPLEKWPAQWQRQLSRTRKGRFAWTYMDLGADLLSSNFENDGSGSQEEARKLRGQRAQCLRKIFADLGHPAGTHTFWPIAIPDNADSNEEPVNTDCFWSGLERLECRGVIIMGSPAAYAAMGTKDLKPLSQLFKFGKLVWILWEAHVLGANPVVYSKAITFLRRSLANFIRL